MTSLWLVMIAMIMSLFISFYYMRKSFVQKNAKKHAEKWFNNDTQGRKSFILLIGDKFDHSEFAKGLSKKLIQANLKSKPSEYAAICFVLFVFLWFVDHSLLHLLFPIDVVLAYFLVWLGSKLFLKSRQNKRSEAFNKILPEICRIMSNAIKAGLTIPQGIEMVSKEIKEPAKSEFLIMRQQLRLGDDIDDVMERFQTRVISSELNIFVSTILIQRTVGGNLSEVLSLMAETLEERARVNKEVQTVTAEAKYVSYILPLLPIMMGMMMNMFIPGFLNPLFTGVGMILIIVFAAFQVVAFILIRRVTSIRV